MGRWTGVPLFARQTDELGSAGLQGANTRSRSNNYSVVRIRLRPRSKKRHAIATMMDEPQKGETPEARQGGMVGVCLTFNDIQVTGRWADATSPYAR